MGVHDRAAEEEGGTGTSGGNGACIPSCLRVLNPNIIPPKLFRSYEMHDHLQHKLVDPDRLVAIAEKSITA